MAVWTTIRQRAQSLLPSDPNRWLPSVEPINRSIVGQAGIAAGAGLFLGIYVLGVSRLSSQMMLMALAAALGLFGVIIIGHLRKLLLAVIIVEITFPLDIYLNYQTDLAEIGALGGFNISVTTGCLLALYTLWLGNALIGAGYAPRPRWFANPPLVIYIALATISTIVAVDKTLSSFEIFLLLQSFLLFTYIASTVKTREEVVFIVTILLITLLFEALVMIGLRGIGRSIEIGPLTARIDSGGRVGGTVGSPNGAGGYLSLLLVPALSLLIARWGSLHKLLAITAFGLGTIALILTQSRGGWLAFGGSLTLFMFITWRRGWISLTMPTILLLVSVGVAITFQDAIVARLFGNDEGSAASRLPLIDLAFRIIRDHPFLGIGTNNFAALIRSYDTPDFGNAWLYVVHNKYLLIWAEMGLLGLAAFLGFLMLMIYRGWRAAVTNDHFLAPLAIAFSTAIAGHMFHMLFDVFNGRTQIQLLWLCAAIITVIDHSRLTDPDVDVSISST